MLLEKRRDTLRDTLPVGGEWKVADARVDGKDVRLRVEHVRGSEPAIEIRFTWEVMADYLFENDSPVLSGQGRGILWRLAREHVEPKPTTTMINFTSSFAEMLLREESQ